MLYKYLYISLEYVILSCYEVYRQILVKTLQNTEKDSKFLMKILINLNISVDKNIFVDKQLWQILSGKIFVLLKNIYIFNFLLFYYRYFIPCFNMETG